MTPCSTRRHATGGAEGVMNVAPTGWEWRLYAAAEAR